MGRRGPPAKPPETRALHASRTRPHHRDPASITLDALATAIASPPRALVKAELAYWRRTAPLLAGARLLTAADVETLADYCRANAALDDRLRRLRQAWRRRRPDHALVGLLDRQARGWAALKGRLAGDLGLTANSRARIGWTGRAAPSSTPPSDAPRAAPSKLADLQQRAAALRRPAGVVDTPGRTRRNTTPPDRDE